jgi:uncharacterized glyoxalase superfamily metalloenzyme YdcJ
MKVDVGAALTRAVQSRLRNATTDSTAVARLSTTHAESPAARVTLSREATSASSPNDQNATEMREILGKYDFHSITPREMARIGTELFSRHELSDVATSAFIGIENNLIVAQDPDKPIDVVAHFEHLLAIETRYEADNGTENGVRFRQTGLDALRDVISFASSDRPHISR